MQALQYQPLTIASTDVFLPETENQAKREEFYLAKLSYAVIIVSVNGALLDRVKPVNGSLVDRVKPT